MRWSTNGPCQVIERCSYSSWRDFGKLIVYDDNQEICPNIPQTIDDMSIQPSKFEATGFALSTVKTNDPAVTGFQSIKYKGPLRVRYVNINVIMQSGFEDPKE
jgi:hypothetical protein